MNATAVSVVLPGLVAAANNTAAIAALKAGTLGLSLGGGGFLVYYLIGVLDALVRLGIVTPGVTPVAGASAGALASTGFCTGLTMAETRRAALGLAYSCQREGNCGGDLDAQVRRVLRNVLNPDSPRRCQNKGYLQVSKGTLGKTTGLLIGQYRSYSDMIEAATASAFIPFWSASAGNTFFRGAPAVDGGVTNNQPCPPNVTYCIKVSLTPYNYTPNSPTDLLLLFGQAKDGNATSRVSKSPALPKQLTYDADRVAAYYANATVDIRPNVFTPLGLSNDEWNQMVLIPGANATLAYVYDLGLRDGTLWAQRNGLAAAAADLARQRAAAAVKRSAAVVKPAERSTNSTRQQRQQQVQQERQQKQQERQQRQQEKHTHG